MLTMRIVSLLRKNGGYDKTRTSKLFICADNNYINLIKNLFYASLVNSSKMFLFLLVIRNV